MKPLKGGVEKPLAESGMEKPLAESGMEKPLVENGVHWRAASRHRQGA